MTVDLLHRGLKISHLRLIGALRDSGQVGSAATDLGITQPAASRLLAEIEQITGTAVHRREGRGVALTDAGHALGRRAARILQEIDDAGRELTEIDTGFSGEVRIGSVTGPSLDHVLPAVRRAMTDSPGLSVEVEVGASDLLATLLLDGRLDMALCRLPDGTDPALFDAQMLGTEVVDLVVRAGHPLLDRHPTATDVLALDWIMQGKKAILRQTVEARLAALGLPMPRVPVSTSSFLVTLAVLQESDAVAPMARAVTERFAGPERGYAVLPVDLGIVVSPFALVTRSGAILTPAANRMRDLILG